MSACLELKHCDDSGVTTEWTDGYREGVTDKLDTRDALRDLALNEPRLAAATPLAKVEEMMSSAGSRPRRPRRSAEEAAVVKRSQMGAEFNRSTERASLPLPLLMSFINSRSTAALSLLLALPLFLPARVARR